MSKRKHNQTNAKVHGKWRRLSGEQFEDITVALRDAINNERAKGHILTAFVGSDSQVYGATITFATVIVILREKKGGFFFIKTLRKPAHHPGVGKKGKKLSVKERILLETQMSIETALEIHGTLAALGLEPIVHADINRNPLHASNSALSEAIGYATGMGLKVEAKPDAWVATYAADKVC